MDKERLINRDLIWAPGTGHITRPQMDAIRTRHNYAIRPIPSKTALGYEHLMADADRAALIAEVDRLNGYRDAVLEVHRPVEAYSRFPRRVYHFCWECSDDGGDGSRGHIEWPCNTAKAAGATMLEPATVEVTVDGTSMQYEIVPFCTIGPCTDPATNQEYDDHDLESSVCLRCGFMSAPCEGIDRGWDGWPEDCENEAEWLTLVGTETPTLKSYCRDCAEDMTKVHPMPLPANDTGE